MAWNRTRNGHVVRCLMAVGLVAFLIVYVTTASYSGTTVVPEYTKPVQLSGDAAKIAAEALANAMKLLQNGGPPRQISEAEAAKRTIQDELKQESTPGYSQEQYLADYRKAFLKKWTAHLKLLVKETPKGGLRLAPGPSYCTA